MNETEKAMVVEAHVIPCANPTHLAFSKLFPKKTAVKIIDVNSRA